MPPLQRQVVELPVVKGMNQGVDRRILPNNEWTRLINLVTDQQGAAHKRSGYGALPIAVTAHSPSGSAFPDVVQWMDTRQDELVIRGRRSGVGSAFNQTIDREWSWSPGLQQWAEIDYVTTCSTSAEHITTITSGAVLPTVAITGDGVEVWTWQEVFDPVLHTYEGPHFLARDMATGAVIHPEDTTALHWRIQKAVTAGNTAVILGHPAASATLDAVQYTPSTDTLNLFGALQPIGVPGCIDAANAGPFRFVTAVAGPANTDITISTYDQTLALLDTNTIHLRDTIFRIAVAWAPFFGFRVVFASFAAGVYSIQEMRFDDVAGLPLAWTTLVATPLAAVAYVSVGAESITGNSVALWQETDTITPPATSPLFSQQLDAAGALSGVLLQTANTTLRTKPWSVEQRMYAIASPLPGGDLFTLDLCTAPDFQASRGWACEGMFGVAPAYQAIVDQAHSGYICLPEVPLLVTPKWLAPIEETTRPEATGVGSTSGSFAVALTLDFSEQQSACPVSAEYQYCTARSGAQVGWYDGEQDVELSFTAKPVLSNGSAAAGPGPTGPGSWEYKAVYEWIDAQGNLHQSETSDPIIVTTAIAAPVTIDFDFTHLGTTRKGRRSQGTDRPVQVALFRTTSPSGQIFYRLTPPNGAPQNDTTTATGHYTDQQTDAGLVAANYGQIYTTGGILDNRPLPGSRAVVAWNNRLWSASADDGKTLWFSKLAVVNEAPGFSEGFTLRVDDVIDSIIGLGAMDDKLIVFAGTRIYYVSGDGPNDTGGGGAFNGPIRIAADSGCVDARSIISYPSGVMYASPAGIFEVSRSLQVSAKGLPVLDETTGCTYLSTWLNAADKRMLWLVTGGTVAEYNGPRILVYDYAFDVWTVWFPYRNSENPEPDPTLSAQVIWQGSHLWAQQHRVSQAAFGAQPWLDAGGVYFSCLYVSPWVKLSGVADYQRTYRITMTGKAFSNHSINLVTYTDYDETTIQQQRSWVSTSLQGAPQVERVQMHVKTQLASAIKVRMYDTKPVIVQGSGPIGGFDLASLAFEIGTKAGSPRLPSTNRG